MTNIATPEQIKKFQARKGDRSNKEIGEKLMVSPEILEQFENEQQIENDEIFENIVKWANGEPPGPRV